MDRGLHAFGLQAPQHVVPSGHPDHVEVPDVLISRPDSRQDHLVQVGQHLGVPQRRLLAGRVPPGQPRQFGPQHGGLEGIEARVEAQSHMLVLVRTAVIAENRTLRARSADVARTAPASP